MDKLIQSIDDVICEAEVMFSVFESESDVSEAEKILWQEIEGCLAGIRSERTAYQNMLNKIDLQRIETIANHAKSLIKTIQDDQRDKAEAHLFDGIMYQAAIAQARCVEPPNGWDRFGR